MSRHQTFSKLVQSQQDFVGMVAYTIYKNEKINWIEAFIGLVIVLIIGQKRPAQSLNAA